MKHYKIICITQIYNELEKGNLNRFIKYVKPLCDYLIVYDDASTDGSYEYIKKYTQYVFRGKKNDFENEIAHKQLMLEKAKELGADFVFYLDADEVLSAGAKEKLKKLAQMCIDKNIDGLQFHKINLWRSHTWRRTDSLFDIGWFTHFWRIKPETQFGRLKKGLHQNPNPPTVKNIRRSKDIAILHYGFANEKNLAYKYLTYKSFRQRGYISLDRLISEETLCLEKVPKELYPDGLYTENEPMPQKKSFSESLRYVEKYKKNWLLQRPNQPAKYSDKSMPLVSIITATYNRAGLLKKTMESVLSQEYPNLEFIIIDDGSTDSTQKVVTDLKKQFKKRKIIYIKQKNTGETAAVNKGFSLVKGKYVAVISSDDPILQGCVDEIVEYLEKNPKVFAVYPDWEMIDENGDTLQAVHPQDYNYLTMLKEHYCIPGPGTFFRKKALGLTGGRSIDFRYLADYAFWLKLGMYGSMYHLPKTLATFRVHSGSQGIYAKGKEMAEESKRLVDWVYSDSSLPVDASRVKRAAYASAYYHAAKKSTTFFDSVWYFTSSCMKDPFVFLKKVLLDVKNNLQ